MASNSAGLRAPPPGEEHLRDGLRHELFERERDAARREQRPRVATMSASVQPARRAAARRNVDVARGEEFAAGALGRPAEVRMRSESSTTATIGVAAAARRRRRRRRRAKSVASTPSITRHRDPCRTRARRTPPRRTSRPRGGTTVTLPMPPMFCSARQWSRRREQQRVGDGHEGSALPARGDVAHAEVGDHRQTRALGDHRRLTELPGGVRRLVPHGVAVRRDRGDVGPGDAASAMR